MVAGSTTGFSADVNENAKAELAYQEIEKKFSHRAMLRSKAEYIKKSEKPTKFFSILKNPEVQ